MEILRIQASCVIIYKEKDGLKKLHWSCSVAFNKGNAVMGN